MFKDIPTSVPLSTPDSKPSPRLIRTQLGVWEVIQEAQTWFRLSSSYHISLGANNLLATFPYLGRFVKDVYRLGPRLLITYLLSSVWQSLETTITLYYSSRLLNVVSFIPSGIGDDW